MKDKTYEITINSNRQHVWNIMLGENSYPQWTKGFSENPAVVGQWIQGAEIDFLDSDKGGTRAVLEVIDEPYRILAKHIAGIDKDRKIITEGMENWIGTTEEYVLVEDNGKTNLKINMHYHSDFEKMLDEGWPKCLELLKKLCEK